MEFIKSLFGNGEVDFDNKVKQAATVLNAIIGPKSEMLPEEKVKALLAWWKKWPENVKKSAYTHEAPSQTSGRTRSVDRIGSISAVNELLPYANHDQSSALNEIYS